jgi:hypothetical protein
MVVDTLVGSKIHCSFGTEQKSLKALSRTTKKIHNKTTSRDVFSFPKFTFFQVVLP